MYPQSSTVTASNRACIFAHALIIIACWAIVQQGALAQKPTLTNEQRTKLDELSEYQTAAIKLNDLGLASDARVIATRVLDGRKAVVGALSPEVADSMSDLGLICREQADYPAARNYLEQALAINRKERGAEHPATATVHERLSMLLEPQGEVPKARENIDQAVRIRKKVLGEQNPATLSAMIYQGELIRLQGKLTEARPVSEQALKLCQSILGEEHRDTARAYAALGDYFHIAADDKNARPNYERALAIRQKVLGQQHPETAASMMRWSIILMADRKDDEARALLNQAYEVVRKMRGEDHPETAYILSPLGQLEVSLGNYDTGIEMLDRVVAIYRKKLGEQHHDTASGLSNLGYAHLSKGDLDKAIKTTEQSQSIFKKVWGLDHPDSGNAAYIMGFVLYSKGDVSAANAQFLQGQKTLAKFYGEGSDYVATGHYHLGLTAQAEKNFPSARKHLEQAMAIYTKNHDEENESSLTSRRALGLALLDLKEYQVAKRQFDQLLTLRRKVSGANSAETADAAGLLGGVHYTLSEFDDARKYYNEALATQTTLFGEENLNVALTQYNIGRLLQSQNNPVQAEAFLKKSLATRRKLLGEQHQDTKDTLTALATNSTSSPAPASKTVPKAVAPPTMPSAPAVQTNNQSSAPGGDMLTPEDIARLSPAQLARVPALLPRLEKAIALYQQGKFREFLPVAEALGQELSDVFGPVHKITALAIAMRGAAHNALAEYDAAQTLLEKGLSMQLQLVGEKNLSTAEILIELSDFYLSRGNIRKATEYANRCLAIRQSLLGENDSATAMTYGQLGVIARVDEDYELARSLLERALAILKKTPPSNSTDQQVKLARNLGLIVTNLAFIQYVSGEVLKARENYELVLKLRREVLGEQHPETAFSLLLMATIHFNLGDLPLSQKYIEQALAIYKVAYGEKHPMVAGNELMLGEVCIARKNFSEARTHLEKARSIRRELLGENDPDYAASLVSLGNLERDLANYTEAKKYYDAAFLTFKRSGAKESLSNIIPLTSSITELYLLQGKSKEARESADELVRLVKSSVAKDTFDLAIALRMLSEAHAGSRAWPEATQNMDTARRLVRRLAADVLPGLSERELLQCLRTADEEFWHSALSMGIVKKDDQAIVDLSAAWLVNGKGIAQESLAKQQATRLAKREGLSPAELPTTGKWIELDTLRKSLPSDTTVFDFARIRIRNFSSTTREEIWGSARYLVWIVPPRNSGAVRIIDLGDAESIDRLVADFNQAMKSSMTAGKNKGTIEELGDIEATKLIDKPLRELAKRIIEPLKADLQKNQKIVLSPDASLWLVPWAALPIDDDKYLIEEHPMQLVVSSRELVRSKNVAPQLTPPVIMADPGFDLNSQQVQAATKAVLRSSYQPLPTSGLRSASITSELPKVKRLPYTAVEAQTILPNVEAIASDKPIVYTGEYALEGVFKKVIQPKMVILSTHGVFLPAKQNKVSESSFASASKPSDTALVAPTENPLLRCGLLLAGCNQRPVSTTDDDGILTGDEIMACNLRGTELVVLSACETGVGEVRNGDGVAGLRQAFQLAGAKSVVATLWVIDDRESAYFMRDFFKQLGDKQSPADAMRSAQLQRIEARRSRFGAAHPFYWAAWTLTGGIE